MYPILNVLQLGYNYVRLFYTAIFRLIVFLDVYLAFGLFTDVAFCKLWLCHRNP